jgi:hypothetical protein
MYLFFGGAAAAAAAAGIVDGRGGCCVAVFFFLSFLVLRDAGAPDLPREDMCADVADATTNGFGRALYLHRALEIC